MTHTRGYARNKEQDMPEGAEQSVAHTANGIASARVSFGLISAGAVSHCNCGKRGNGMFRRYSRSVSEQILSSHQQH